jgi:hypothetical protein
MNQGRIQGGRTRRAPPPPPPPPPLPPPKIAKNVIFWRKFVTFHTKYTKYFRASLRSAQFFYVHPPNLKSWIRPCSWTILVYAQWFQSRRLKCKNLKRTDGAHHVMAKSKNVVYLADQFFVQDWSMKKLRMSVGWWMPHYEEVKDVNRLLDATLQRS